MNINMKSVTRILIAVGAGLLLISMLVGFAVKSNTDIQELEKFMGIEVSPEGLGAIGGMASMFGIELDAPTKLMISLYKNTPAMNTLGWIALVVGIALYIINKFNKP